MNRAFVSSKDKGHYYFFLNFRSTSETSQKNYCLSFRLKRGSSTELWIVTCITTNHGSAHEDLQNFIQRPNRTQERRIPEASIVSILFYPFEADHQIIEIVQLRGFEIGGEVEIVQPAGVVELALDGFEVRDAGLRVLLHERSSRLLIQQPPFGILPNGDDDCIRLAPGSVGVFRAVFHSSGRLGT